MSYRRVNWLYLSTYEISLENVNAVWRRFGSLGNLRTGLVDSLADVDVVSGLNRVYDASNVGDIVHRYDRREASPDFPFFCLDLSTRELSVNSWPELVPYLRNLAFVGGGVSHFGVVDSRYDDNSGTSVLFLDSSEAGVCFVGFASVVLAENYKLKYFGFVEIDGAFYRLADIVEGSQDVQLVVVGKVGAVSGFGYFPFRAQDAARAVHYRQSLGSDGFGFTQYRYLFGGWFRE